LTVIVTKVKKSTVWYKWTWSRVQDFTR